MHKAFAFKCGSFHVQLLANPFFCLPDFFRFAIANNLSRFRYKTDAKTGKTTKGLTKLPRFLLYMSEVSPEWSLALDGLRKHRPFLFALLTRTLSSARLRAHSAAQRRNMPTRLRFTKAVTSTFRCTKISTLDGGVYYLSFFRDRRAQFKLIRHRKGILLSLALIDEPSIVADSVIKRIFDYKIEYPFERLKQVSPSALEVSFQDMPLIQKLWDIQRFLAERDLKESEIKDFTNIAVVALVSTNPPLWIDECLQFHLRVSGETTLDAQIERIVTSIKEDVEEQGLKNAILIARYSS